MGARINLGGIMVLIPWVSSQNDDHGASDAIRAVFYHMRPTFQFREIGQTGLTFRHPAPAGTDETVLPQAPSSGASVHTTVTFP